MKNKIALITAFIAGISVTFLTLMACANSTAQAATDDSQSLPLKIWAQNRNGSEKTMVVVDSDTGVNYVVVTAQNYSNAETIAITPRLKADGSLYTESDNK